MNIQNINSIIYEGSIKKSKTLKQILTYPMFTVYLDNTLLDNIQRFKYKKISKAFLIKTLQETLKLSRYRISKMGFSHMHTNIILKDLSEEITYHTGQPVSGYAYKNYMVIDIGNFIKKYSEDIIIKQISDVIVHEWAHIWMTKNTKSFKIAVLEFYNKIKSELNNDLDQNLEYIDIDEKEVDECLKYWIQKFHSLFGDYRMKAWIYQNLKEYKNINILKNLIFNSILCSGNKEYIDIRLTETNIEVYENRVKIEDIPYNDFKKISKWANINNILLCINKTINNISVDIETFLFDNFQNTLYAILDESATEELVKSISTGVLTALKNLIKNKKILLSSLSKDDFKKDMYNILWVYNKNKKIIITNEIRNHMINSKIRYIKNKNNLSGPDLQSIRDLAAETYNWPDSYGMSNDLELWATGVEYFFNLPVEYQKGILKLAIK